MGILYQLGIYVLYFGAHVFALFNTKTKLAVRGRKGWQEKLKLIPAKQLNQKRIWFHCSSLGEFEQAVPVLETLKLKGAVQLVVTFFSSSGYEKIKHHKLPDAVLYLPFDTKSNASRFVQDIQADVVCFIKYEFWLNTLQSCMNHDIPLYLISAVFRKNQIFFKWYGGIFRDILSGFRMIFTQDENSVELLKRIGVVNAVCTGDTRFDRVLKNKSTLEPPEQISWFAEGKPLFVVGSSWPEEEETVKQSVDYVLSRYKLIIVPHEISETRIRQILHVFRSVRVRRFTEITSKENSEADVLIVDTVGHLAGIYKSARIAMVGGGFKNALHNILEPLAFGIPLLFGPRTENYPEANLSIAANAAVSFGNAEELKLGIQQIEDRYNTYKSNATTFIEKGAGATATIIRYLETDHLSKSIRA